MSGFLLFALIVSAVLLIIFFPIVVFEDLFLDLKGKKFAFCSTFYKKIKFFGGYFTLYDGGVALHVKKDEAILLPFNETKRKRKGFAFVKICRFISLRADFETPLEGIFSYLSLQEILSIIGEINKNVFKKYRLTLSISNIENLKISAEVVFYFNFYILSTALIEFLWRKIKELWEKRKKSII